ncbi:MAG: hypothetical protein ACOYBQ_10250 [Fluviibacter sp.]
MRVNASPYGDNCGCGGACPRCGVMQTMDPSNVSQYGPQFAPYHLTLGAAPTESAAVDRSATLGDLATLLGVLSAILYFTRG